jgi:hypothetical protein
MLLFEECAQFWTWKVINKQIRHIWAVFIHMSEHKYNGSLDQSKTLHIHWCHLVAKTAPSWLPAVLGCLHCRSSLQDWDDGTGRQLLVLGRSLGQDGPHSNIRIINLYHKLTGRIWMDEDGFCGEPMLQVHEGSVDRWRPCKQYFGRGECRERGRQGTVAPNETPV